MWDAHDRGGSFGAMYLPLRGFEPGRYLLRGAPQEQRLGIVEAWGVEREKVTTSGVVLHSHVPVPLVWRLGRAVRMQLSSREQRLLAERV